MALAMREAPHHTAQESDRRFVHDSLLEGGVTSELVSETVLGGGASMKQRINPTQGLSPKRKNSRAA
jgi:hypothetical protein